MLGRSCPANPWQSINEMQCVRQCTCTCYAVYDMCMLCFAVALVLSIVTPIHTFYSRCDLELQVYTQVGVFCKVYSSVQLYLRTL